MKTLLAALSAFILFFCLLHNAHSVDRCNDFKNDVRIEHTKYFGLGSSWWYALGQLRQESNCRNVTAFDGGMGVAQFMPATSKAIQKEMKQKLDPKNAQQAIRMQNFYLYSIHKHENFTKEKYQFITYQIYNGGSYLLKKDYVKAGSIADHDKMWKQCSRKILHLKWGDLNLCDVNYDYPQKIEKYAKPYKMGPDRIPFW